jgi:hypothetical protein
MFDLEANKANPELENTIGGKADIQDVFAASASDGFCGSAVSSWLRYRVVGDGLPIYDVDARLTLRSLRRPATRARRLPRLRALENLDAVLLKGTAAPDRVV